MTESNAGAGNAGYFDRRSLYLRYRPRRFADVVAQESITRTLRNAVARDTVAHAYLLCGPRGTGKTSIARILYRALNCLNPDDGEPCGECHSCRAADAGSAVDLIEMDAASHGGIDDIRDIRERVYFSPVEARSKVYIVDEAHQLTTRAWDAFLKTLEEPPPRTVFVLATTEAHRVPATIVSRCQRFDLRRIPQGRMQEHLEAVARWEGIELEAGVAERLSRLARGSLRDGISTLEQVAAFAGESVTMDATRNVLGLVRGDALRSYLDALSLGDAARALQLLENISEQGADLRQFLDEVLFYLRGVLLTRSGAASSLEGQFGPEERSWLEQLADRWSPGQILSILRAFGEIESRGRDEHHVLVRSELTTAWCVGLLERPQTMVPPETRARQNLSATTEHAASTETRPAEDPSPALVGDQEAEGSTPLVPQERSGEGSSSAIQSSSMSEKVPPSAPHHPAPSPIATGDGEARNPSLSAPVISTSIVALQAEWPALIERFQGSLLARMRLRSVAPVALEDGLVTLAGPLDQLDLQRLDVADSRAVIEALLQETTGLALKVRFRQADVASLKPEQPDEPAFTAEAKSPDRPSRTRSLADLGSTLFGGSLISEEAGQG